MCGLYGFSAYKDSLQTDELNDLLNALSVESSERGTDATGIAYLLDGKLEIEKEAKSAHDILFKIPKDTFTVTAHTRHSTQGSERKNFNNHPFKGRFKDGSTFALAHNGILYNDRTLRTKHKLPATKIETDSYIATQLLELKGDLTMESLAFMAEEVSGSFTFTVIDEHNSIWIAKGDSPLSLLHFKELGLYVYASTDRILWRAISSSPLLSHLKDNAYNAKGAIEEIQLNAGQILKISPDGKLEYGSFNYQQHSYFMPYHMSWWDYGKRHFKKPTRAEDSQDEYIENLKTVASSMGFRPEDIDDLLDSGWSLDELEEYLYSGEMCGYEYAMEY